MIYPIQPSSYKITAHRNYTMRHQQSQNTINNKINNKKKQTYLIFNVIDIHINCKRSVAGDCSPKPLFLNASKTCTK